jgi:hypothetical protein
MTQSAWSRGRRIALGLAAAVVAALAVYRWAANSAAPAARPPAAASWATPTVAPRETSGGAVRAATVDVPTHAAVVPPTHRAVDFAAMTPAGRPKPATDADRFTTTEWFTEEDLRHPERYFAMAERIPELNRPEERRQTLEFFLAYREKLQRDLREAEPAAREEVLATIARYDAAIARLRAVMQN